MEICLVSKLYCHPAIIFNSILTGNVPSQAEVGDDISSLLESFLSLCWLLMSSAIFRLLLSDSLAVLQNLAATAAVEVDSVAAKVGSTAERVEASVRVGSLSMQGARDAVEGAKEDVAYLREEEKRRLLALKAETANKMSRAFVMRVQQVRRSLR